MAELLSQDKDMAASFLNSVLNQLNWAFSEFIGMIQEVRNSQKQTEQSMFWEHTTVLGYFFFFTLIKKLNKTLLV